MYNCFLWNVVLFPFNGTFELNRGCTCWGFLVPDFLFILAVCGGLPVATNWVGQRKGGYLMSWVPLMLCESDLTVGVCDDYRVLLTFVEIIVFVSLMAEVEVLFSR